MYETSPPQELGRADDSKVCIRIHAEGPLRGLSFELALYTVIMQVVPVKNYVQPACNK